MNIKRNLYIIIIAIIIYFVLIFCYNKFILKDDYSYFYVLSKDVLRGEKILNSHFIKVKILNNNFNTNMNKNKYLSDDKVDGYYNDDYYQGSIMLNKMVILSNNYLNAKQDNEIVSIKLNFSEDAGSYQLKKGSIVNIFYSAKLSEIESLYNNINKESILSNNLKSGFVTIKLLEKVKIINCYDKYGNIPEKGNVIETILVEVSKEDSIKIFNLKNSGKFTISVLK